VGSNPYPFLVKVLEYEKVRQQVVASAGRYLEEPESREHGFSPQQALPIAILLDIAESLNRLASAVDLTGRPASFRCYQLRSAHAGT